MLDALEWGQKELAAKRNGEVKTCFNKYDTDQSGSVDEDELRNLYKDLGVKLTKHEQKEAL